MCVCVCVRERECVHIYAYIDSVWTALAQAPHHRVHGIDDCDVLYVYVSSIDMYNNDVSQESGQKFMKQTGALKAATLYFAS